MGTAMRGMRQAAAGASRLTPGRGARWGALGGLAGTAAMDVALIAALSAAGLPALSCYSLVGDTVARFFALLGIGLAGGIPLGIAAHYVIGPVIGAIYGAAAALSGALRAAGLKRNILWAILYVELVQPAAAGLDAHPPAHARRRRGAVVRHVHGDARHRRRRAGIGAGPRLAREAVRAYGHTPLSFLVPQVAHALEIDAHAADPPGLVPDKARHRRAGRKAVGARRRKGHRVVLGPQEDQQALVRDEGAARVQLRAVIIPRVLAQRARPA